MSTIIVTAATVQEADRIILHNVTLTVGPDTRLALVGPNGVGKTTLLRLLAGERRPDVGGVERRPRHTTVGLVPQERDRRSGELARAYLRRRTGVAAAEAALDRAAAALANGEPGADDDYAAALDRYLALGGPDLDARIPGVLRDVSLDAAVLDLHTTALSGGQLARLALASILLSSFEVLLLDEPTNDLDLDGVELLEAHLTERRGGLVVVSHDRAFLERTTTAVAEIDEFSHEVRVYGGGYAAFVEERDRAHRRAVEEFDAYETRRAHLIEQARRQRTWARSGSARARSSGERDKFIRHAHVQGAQSRGAVAARVERALERLQAVESPNKPWDLRLTLTASGRSGDQVASLSAAVVRRGMFTLGPIDLDIRWGDRVAIVGPNGSGKSTLVAALLGRLRLESGSARLGRGVVVGEIGQVRRGLPLDLPLTRAFRDATGQTESDARTLLAKFGLGADDVGRPVRSLSPGERTRAELALLAARRVNLLVLDEPTNHLDLPAVEQLGQALAAYDGTLVLVTHDRQLLGRVQPTHVVRLGDQRTTRALRP